MWKAPRASARTAGELALLQRVLAGPRGVVPLDAASGPGYSAPGGDPVGAKLRVVAIGGGTGLPVMLRGLRELHRRGEPGSERLDPDLITAVVSVADDGGSSGRLVDTFETLPPGDIRNCLLALADEDAASVLHKFFGYRFSEAEDGDLAGHSVGNLIITALTRLNGNDFRQAILDVARMLSLRGRILFPTLERLVLCARLRDGAVVCGESRIRRRKNPARIDTVYLAERSCGADTAAAPLPPFAPRAFPEALDAIREADVVLLGPGSLYSSVLPNLLVPEIAEAVAEHARTKPLVYVCNIMTEPGETDGYSVEDHVRAIRRHADLPIHLVIANRQRIPEQLLERYARANLLAGCASVRQALEDVAALDNGHMESALLIEHAESQGLRLQRLAHRMRDAMNQQIQVLPSGDEHDLGGARIVEVDAVLEAEVVDGGRTKRVIRHDAVAVLREILSRV